MLAVSDPLLHHVPAAAGGAALLPGRLLRVAAARPGARLLAAARAHRGHRRRGRAAHPRHARRVRVRGGRADDREVRVRQLRHS